MIFLGEKSSIHAGDQNKDKPFGELLLEKNNLQIQ